MDPFFEWDWADWAYFIVTFLAGIGVLAIGLQIIGERNARHREFENMYVQRYWDISSRLPARFVQGHPDYTLSESEKSAICDYLLLCEDELDLRKRAYITDQTWKIWMSGVIFATRDAQVRLLIDEFPADRLECIKELMTDGRDYFDPLKRIRIRRWWNGLR